MTLSVAIHDMDDILVPAVTLTDTFERSIQEVLNDAGSGTFSVLESHPDLAELTFGRLAMITDSIAATRFGVLIESQERVILEREGLQTRVVRISGRLLPALLEGAVVEPEGGAALHNKTDTRYFNFASPYLDDSGWASAVETPLHYEDPAGNPFGPLPPRNPQGWPDDTAMWIWDRDSGYNGVPPGTVWFRHSFTVGSPFSGGLWVAADDAFEVWLDGQPQFSEGFDTGYLGRGRMQPVSLSAGDHLLAVRAENLNSLKAGLLVSLVELDADGDVVSVITNSSDAWVQVGYTDPPGFTAGEVLDILIYYEAQNGRGGLAGLDTTFGASVTSDSESWPVVPEIALKVGDDYLTVLRQLVPAYIDFKVSLFDEDPTIYLEAYAAGSLGVASGVEYEAGISLAALRVDGEG